MKDRYHLFAARVLVFAALSASLGGCSSSALYLDEPSGTLGYVPGAPNFDVRIAPAWRDGQSGAVVHVGIPATSLVFTPRGATYDAEYDLILRVIDADETLVDEQLRNRTISVGSYDSTLTFSPFLHEEFLGLAPGPYVVQAIVIDAASGQQRMRSSVLRVPLPGEVFLGRPEISNGHLPEDRRPVLTSFVPEQSGPLRASVRYRSEGSAGDVELRLVRVERDTTSAVPPYWVGPGYGTLSYQGIAASEVDTVLAVRFQLDAAADTTLQVDLPDLQRGLYRLDAEHDAAGRAVEMRRHFFIVTHATFPRIETLDQMVESLAYIAYEREIERIREPLAAAERRKRFDAFWGSLVRQRSVAVNLLETYYERIEEANLLYSGYKEGWKTDRGMIYVLLGAPVLVDDYAESEIWRYSYDDDALYTFVFDRVKIPESDGAYENYILRRRPYYEHVWLQLVDRWRSGVVL